MADSTELMFLERMAEKVGVSAALRICAYWGKRSLYVPPKISAGHLLVKVIGLEAAQRLVGAFPGEHLSVPACELEFLRRASRVAVLWKYGVPPSVSAAVLDISPQRVNQIRRQLGLEGYDADALLPMPYGMPESDDAGETGQYAGSPYALPVGTTAAQPEQRGGRDHAE